MNIFKSFSVAIIGLGLVHFVAACSRPAGIGLPGRYLDGRTEVTKRTGGDLTKAVYLLESVAAEDPYYKDSLTLLGRAYYKRGRYTDAFQILQRSLAVNAKDEIGWILLGLTQLRLGQEDKGLESMKGGLTLFSKVAQPGYRGLESWDVHGNVRRALNRAVFASVKGLADKDRIIRDGELLLNAIDFEEYLARGELEEERRS